MQGVRTGLHGQHLHAVDDRRGVVEHRLPRHDPGQHHRHADVEHGADDQRGDNSDRQVALRIASFLGGGRNRIESDVGEENDRAAGQDARPSHGSEGMPVGWDGHSAQPTMTNARIAAIFRITMTLLASADSRMPRTRITVKIMTTRNAGKLKPK